MNPFFQSIIIRKIWNKQEKGDSDKSLSKFRAAKEFLNLKVIY